MKRRQLDLFAPAKRKPTLVEAMARGARLSNETGTIIRQLRCSEFGRVNGMTKAELRRRYPKQLPVVTAKGKEK